MHVQPYLYFNGRCEEALDFYRRALGAEVIMQMRFNESPVPMEKGEGNLNHEPSGGCGEMPPGYEEKIMHCSFRIGSTEIMASDGFCSNTLDFQGFALSLIAADKAEAQQKFERLAEGGAVCMPLEPTFFSDAFGMVTDRFGILWNVLVEAPQ